MPVVIARSRKTLVSTAVSINVNKRFYPGGISNPPTATLARLTDTTFNTNIKVLTAMTARIALLKKMHLQARESILVKNKQVTHQVDSASKSMANMEVVSKPNTFKSVYKDLYNDETMFTKALFQYLFCLELPGTLITRMHIAQRVFPDFTVSRGYVIECVRQQLVDDSTHTQDLSLLKASQVLYVENAAGTADVGFLSEIGFSVQSILFMQRNEISVQRWILCSATLPNSPERVLSEKLCGQLNNDAVIHVKTKEGVKEMYIDIKQRSPTPEDWYNFYIKAVYFSKQPELHVLENSTDEVKELLITYKEQLERISAPNQNTLKFIQTLETLSMEEQFGKISIFIIDNYPNIQMSLIFPFVIHVNLSEYNINKSIIDEIESSENNVSISVIPSIFQINKQFNTFYNSLTLENTSKNSPPNQYGVNIRKQLVDQFHYDLENALNKKSTPAPWKAKIKEIKPEKSSKVSVSMSSSPSKPSLPSLDDVD